MSEAEYPGEATFAGAAVEAPSAYQCEVCGKSFARPQALGAHKAAAHGTRSKRKRNAAARNGRSTDETPEINTDALLRLVFPTGEMPLKLLARTQQLVEDARELHQAAQRSQ